MSFVYLNYVSFFLRIVLAYQQIDVLFWLAPNTSLIGSCSSSTNNIRIKPIPRHHTEPLMDQPYQDGYGCNTRSQPFFIYVDTRVADVDNSSCAEVLLEERSIAVVVGFG
jgi:hypothetical protein